MKLILTFVDEKKGTIFFVTAFSLPSPYSSINYTLFFSHILHSIILMYARTLIYIYIAFLSALYNTYPIIPLELRKSTE